MSSSLPRSAARLRLILILALAVLLFAPSLGNTFALDDRLIAKAVRDDGTPNAFVNEVQPPWRYFVTNYWQGVLAHDVLYRPITVLSYAVLYAVAGRPLRGAFAGEAGEALPQHAANVLLHALVCWLTYLLARRVRLPRGAALVAALVFGVHAIHSEVVAGVVGRAELLAFTFGATAALLGVRGGGRRPGPAALVATAAALFLAFCSKESAVAWAPFVLVLLLVRRLRQDPARSLATLLRPGLGRVLLALAVPLAAFLLLRHAMLVQTGADPAAWTASHERSTAGWRLGNGLVQWAYALTASVLPLHLAADHGPSVFTPTTSLLTPAVAGACVLLVVTAGAGLCAWRRHPHLFLAMAAFFGHSFLTSNVPIRIGTDYAERLYYTPSIGLSFAAAWLAARLAAASRRAWRSVGLAALVLWLAWNGWLVLQRNGVWRDDPTLFAHEVVNQPRSARMHLLHAEQLQRRGDHAGMLPHLERVVELFPDHAEAWNQIGIDHFRAGRREQARTCFERSLTAGHFAPANRVNTAINLAAVLVDGPNPADAARPLEVALATDPTTLAARVPELRRALTGKVSYEWFDGFLARLAAAAPRAQAFSYHRAWLAYESKRFAATIEHARAAHATAAGQPARAEMGAVLAASLASTGNLPEARRFAEQVAADVSAPEHLRSQARELLARMR